jgi:hypothetical protein
LSEGDERLTSAGFTPELCSSGQSACVTQVVTSSPALTCRLQTVPAMRGSQP